MERWASLWATSSLKTPPLSIRCATPPRTHLATLTLSRTIIELRPHVAGLRRLSFGFGLPCVACRHLAFRCGWREYRKMDVTLQPGQLVRVNLAGLSAEGVTFQAAVTDAVAHIVKQTSEQPPKYLVELLFSFRGVSQVEVPADRIHAGK